MKNRRRNVFIKFAIHTVVSLVYSWPIFAWALSFKGTSGDYEAKMKFISSLPEWVIELLSGSSAPLGILVALFSLALMVLGVLSMEYKSTLRWVVTFPLLIMNLACFGFYTFMVM